MLDLPSGTGGLMKLWEKFGWSVWFGFALTLLYYAIQTR